MSAVSDDQLGSMSIGIFVPKVFGLAWAMAGLSGAAAGRIIGNITGLNFDVLHAFGLIVFPVVILGGLDSILGAVVAGIVMGLIHGNSRSRLKPFFEKSFGKTGRTGMQTSGTLLMTGMADKSVCFSWNFFRIFRI